MTELHNIEPPKNENPDIRVVEYDHLRHHDAFRSLNEHWIAERFVVEESDHLVLDHPLETIINKGGHIFMAEYKGDPVGTLSLQSSLDARYDFELVKYAVDPSAQGLGIGKRLMERCLQCAKDLRKNRLFLETNHNLLPAIHLYKKYGFRQIPLNYSDFERTDILMELMLDDTE